MAKRVLVPARLPRPLVVLALVFLTFARGNRAGAETVAPRPEVLTTWHQTQKVYDLARTPDGFLWAGSDSGLLRFDGEDFVTFTTGDGLSGNIVRALAVDAKGGLWAGMAEGHGLARLHRRSVERVDTGDRLAALDVQELAIDAGMVWIGTSEGLFRMSADGAGAPEAVASLAGHPVLALEARDGKVWVGTGRGLFLGGRDGFSLLREIGPVRALASEPGGALWFSASSAGLFRMDATAAEPRLVLRTGGSGPDPDPGAEPIAQGFTALAFDLDGRLWVGWNGGCAILKEDRLEPRFSTGLHTVDLLGDGSGGVWVATYWGVVSRFSTPRVKSVILTPSGQNPIIFAATIDREGALWLSGVASVVRMKGDTIDTLHSGKQLLSWCPRSLSRAAHGGVWLGTCDQAVLHLDQGRSRSVPFADGKRRFVQAVFEDAGGDLWVGAESGSVWKRTGEVLVEQNVPNGSCAPATGDPAGTSQVTLDECRFSPTAIVDARGGGIWMAVRRNGLMRLRDGQWQTWRKDDGLPTNALISLYEDRDGVLWIGSQASGLIQFDGKRFRSVQKEDGLPAQSIHGIVEDGHGYFWMSSERGVFRVARSELSAFFGDRRKRVTGHAYDPRDGLGTFVTLQSFPEPIIHMPDGRVAVPTDVGLGLIDTRAVESTRGFASAVIEDIRIEGRSHRIDMPTRIDLPLGTSRLGSLELHFAVPNFDVPHRIKVAYRLAGRDHEWKVAHSTRVVRYDNLPPGRYSFELQTHLEDRPFGTAVSTTTLRVRGFHQRPAFAALLGLAILPFAAVVFLLRMRYRQARFATILSERNRIARDLHDSLAQYFTGIAYQLERVALMMRNDPAAAEEINEETKLMLAQCRLEARQAIHNMRSETVAQVSFFEALSAVADETRISGSAQVGVETTGRDQQLPGKIQRELLRIAQEATVNALAHAHATRIELGAHFGPDALTLVIEDNGIGFDASDGSRPLHYGLRGMHERCGALGGEFTIKSTPEKGTRVTVRVALGNARP
jgi:signal transduction histidine kinase/ligand-binding sensor domain-containing protein